MVAAVKLKLLALHRNRIGFLDVKNIKQGKSITLDTLNKVCLMTKLRVEDIIEMTATDEEREKYS